MKEEKVSNYIKLCDEWAEKFLRMDKMELMKKLPELKQEDGYLKIVHFGVPFGVRESDGKIERLDGKTEARCDGDAEYLYAVWGMRKRGLLLWISGCRLRIFRNARPFAPAYQDRRDGCVCGATFSGHEKELAGGVS